MFSSRLRARIARASTARPKRPLARLRLTWLEDRVTPASLLVTDGGDTGGSGQLRALLATANSNSEPDTVTFDPSVTAVTLTTALPTYTESQSLTITGNGKLVTTINAPPGGRIFSLESQSTVSITSMILQGGSTSDSGGAISHFGQTLIVDSAILRNNTAGSEGGAIVSYGKLFVSNSCFEGNVENSIVGLGGGAISEGNSSGLVVTKCVFKGNRVVEPFGGGAISTWANTTIDSCDFDSNSVGKLQYPFPLLGGGAILLRSTKVLTINNSTFRGNSAYYSGGAIGANGNLIINQCTFTRNTAGASDGTGNGGAISATSGLTVNNSTIYDNLASANGGGILCKGSAAIINSSIVAGNRITQVGINGWDIWSKTSFALIGNNSIFGSTTGMNVVLSGSYQGGTSQLPLDPMLNPLADNGGPLLPDGNRLKTMSLKVGSPALDMGNNAQGFTTDQRGPGFARTVDSITDVGAFEVQAAPTVNSVVFGDGTNQRSQVKQIVVAFSRPVNFSGSSASAFTLTRTGTNGLTGNVILSATPASGPTSSVTITFSGSFAEASGSLVDGLYDFIISAAQVSGVGGALDGNNDGVPGGSYSVTGSTANKFYRLFGDSDGNATTDLDDYSALRFVFGLGSNTIFDFNGDGQVDLFDFAQFRRRFGLFP